MPKVSKETAAIVMEMGPTTDRYSELDGYRAEFVSIGEDSDLTPLLVGLPNDECQCPHWGYVLSGRMWFRKDGRDESISAGEAFHIAPGHTAGADKGSEFVIFSPSEQIAELEAHMQQRAQQLHGA